MPALTSRSRTKARVAATAGRWLQCAHPIGVADDHRLTRRQGRERRADAGQLLCDAGVSTLVPGSKWTTNRRGRAGCMASSAP
jgi:hypothetical protein